MKVELFTPLKYETGSLMKKGQLTPVGVEVATDKEKCLLR
jgi:hypothetical protein